MTILLAALALATAAAGAPPSCAPYLVRSTPAERAASATILTRAYGHLARPEDISVVIKGSEWMMLWRAASDDVAEYVFFIHGKSGAERFVSKWSGVGYDRGRYLLFARGLHVPEPMARCFADRQRAEPTI